jgi:hypothetical protein
MTILTLSITQTYLIFILILTKVVLYRILYYISYFPTESTIGNKRESATFLPGQKWKRIYAGDYILVYSLSSSAVICSLGCRGRVRDVCQRYMRAWSRDDWDPCGCVLRSNDLAWFFFFFFFVLLIQRIDCELYLGPYHNWETALGTVLEKQGSFSIVGLTKVTRMSTYVEDITSTTRNL